MFKKRNTIVPEIKAKEMERSKAEADLHKFFKTKIKIEIGDRNYTTTFYSAPQETKCCSIL